MNTQPTTVAKPKSYMPVLPYGVPLQGAAGVALAVGQLSVKQPRRVWLALAADYAVIIGAVALFHRYPSFWLWLPLWLIVGARQHALAVLMHDAAHGNLFKSRRLNDWVGQVLCAYPLVVVSLYKYRAKHRLHHTYLNTARDPDWHLKVGTEVWTYPTTPRQLWIRLGRILMGGGVFFLIKAQVFLRVKGERKASVDYGRLVYMAGFLAVITYAQLWQSVALMWFLPMVTTLPLFERVRSIAEHFALPHEHDLSASRSMRAAWFSRFFFAPHHVAYHLEHHLYPMVPFYNLPSLSSHLDRLDHFAKNASVTGSYLWPSKRGSLKQELTTPLFTKGS